MRIFGTFEGFKDALYTRLGVSIKDSDEAALETLVYVSGPAIRATLEGHRDLETFRGRHLLAYRRRIVAA